MVVVTSVVMFDAPGDADFVILYKYGGIPVLEIGSPRSEGSAFWHRVLRHAMRLRSAALNLVQLYSLAATAQGRADR